MQATTVSPAFFYWFLSVGKPNQREDALYREMELCQAFAKHTLNKEKDKMPIGKSFPFDGYGLKNNTTSYLEVRCGNTRG